MAVEIYATNEADNVRGDAGAVLLLLPATRDDIGVCAAVHALQSRLGHALQTEQLGVEVDHTAA